jgi:hypothetical protein
MNIVLSALVDVTADVDKTALRAEACPTGAVRHG